MVAVLEYPSRGSAIRHRLASEANHAEPNEINIDYIIVIS